MSGEDGDQDINDNRVVNVFHGNVVQSVQFGGRVTLDGKIDAYSERRQSFLFDFYSQAFKQAEITFRMSFIFMAIGAAVVLVGGGLALLRGGGPGLNYAALVSSVSGVIIGTCGGAFALHANRARKHLTEQAEKIEKDLQSDRRVQQTLQLIEQVDDQVLRDRLKSVTAMRALDVEPDAQTVTSHLLSEIPAVEPKALPRNRRRDSR
ncbi:TRADD-N-associated membrane domain-containing protein [Saccharothrix sp. Mg75]|uniref:TRADD-N-associated membrane domain-containing protein n=1 Tax=Saccharothrix sp. Mg75 TaxID=3445357 RepID=UPI003EE99D03